VTHNCGQEWASRVRGCYNAKREGQEGSLVELGESERAERIEKLLRRNRDLYAFLELASDEADTTPNLDLA
jgi:hypothetical protein